MPTATKDQQVKLLVEGLALGCLALGVTAVPADKFSFERAIRRSLGMWDFGRAFPSLAGASGANAVWLGLARSANRQTTFAAWSTGRRLEPYVRVDGWTVDEALDALADDRPIPPDAWIELARLFTADLDADAST